MVLGSITSRWSGNKAAFLSPNRGKPRERRKLAEIAATVVTELFSDHLIGFIDSVCLQCDVNVALKRRENSFIKTKILTISSYLVR